MPRKGLLFDVNENEALPLYVDYSIGAGLKFDGVNDYINLPTLPIDVQINSNYSFSVWVKPIQENPSAGVIPIFSKSFYDNNVSYYGFTVVIGNNYFSAQYVQGSNNLQYQAFPVPEIALNQLVHIVWNNQTKELYVNGVLTNLTVIGDVNNPPVYANYPAYLGLTYVNNPFFAQEQIFDFKIFDKQLTQTEVAELYETKSQETPLTAKGNLVMHLDFNQKQGTTTTDKSGNGYHGTLINFLNTTPSPTNAWIDDLGNNIQF